MMKINREELFEINETIEVLQSADTIDRVRIQDLELKIQDTIENMLDDSGVEWNGSRISESIYISYIPEDAEGEDVFDEFQEMRISTHSNGSYHERNIIVDCVYDMFSKIEALLNKPIGLYCEMKRR